MTVANFYFCIAAMLGIPGGCWEKVPCSCREALQQGLLVGVLKLKYSSSVPCTALPNCIMCSDLELLFLSPTSNGSNHSHLLHVYGSCNILVCTCTELARFCGPWPQSSTSRPGPKKVDRSPKVIRRGVGAICAEGLPLHSGPL